jgi:CheY-like chemotaxis protein
MRGVVLVVEDDDDLREVIEHVLREEGYAVACASDGEEGLRLVRQFVPTLILLDNSMPRVDGPSFRAALRAQPKLANVPIVSISGTRPAGGAPALIKPFTVDALLAIVGRYC